MARLTVEQLKELHGFEWSYKITERIEGQGTASFYYNSTQYDEFMDEYTKAQAAGILESAGARFMAR